MEFLSGEDLVVPKGGSSDSLPPFHGHCIAPDVAPHRAGDALYLRALSPGERQGLPVGNRGPYI